MKKNEGCTIQLGRSCYVVPQISTNHVACRHAISRIILGSMRNEMEHGTACVTVGTELATSWVFATLADAHADALPRRALRLRGQASDRESNTTKKREASWAPGGGGAAVTAKLAPANIPPAGPGGGATRHHRRHLPPRPSRGASLRRPFALRRAGIFPSTKAAQAGHSSLSIAPITKIPPAYPHAHWAGRSRELLVP